MPGRGTEIFCEVTSIKSFIYLLLEVRDKSILAMKYSSLITFLQRTRFSGILHSLMKSLEVASSKFYILNIVPVSRGYKCRARTKYQYLEVFSRTLKSETLYPSLEVPISTPKLLKTLQLMGSLAQYCLLKFLYVSTSLYTSLLSCWKRCLFHACF